MKITTIALASLFALSGSLAIAQTSSGGTAAGGSSATGGQGSAGMTSTGKMNNDTSGTSTSGSSTTGTSSQTPMLNDASKSGAPSASSAEKGTGTTSGSMSK